MSSLGSALLQKQVFNLNTLLASSGQSSPPSSPGLIPPSPFPVMSTGVNPTPIGFLGLMAPVQQSMLPTPTPSEPEALKHPGKRGGGKIPPGLAKKKASDLPDGNPWKALLQAQESTPAPYQSTTGYFQMDPRLIQMMQGSPGNLMTPNGLLSNMPPGTMMMA